MSTINGITTNGVILGSGSYPSPLTITSNGYVSYSGTGYAITGSGRLLNQGTVAQTGGPDGAIALAGVSSITNLGTIKSSSNYGAAAYLEGGTIINGQAVAGASNALVQGATGFKAGGVAGTVINYGSIAGNHYAGVVLSTGGTLVNGAGGATLALIQGYLDGVVSPGNYTAQVSNSGTIIGGETAGNYAVLIAGNGAIYNSGTAALITGAGGVSIGLNGTVSNEGTIVTSYGGSAGNTAITIQGDGAVTNTGTAALIAGVGGVTIGQAGTVINAGTILSNAGRQYSGVSITDAGTVSNTGTGALIQGYRGVYIGGAGTVTNQGSIISSGGVNYGVLLDDGGSVTNGPGGNAAALLYGSIGLYVKNAAGTVINDGTVLSPGGYGKGIWLADGGSVVNGATTGQAAQIDGVGYGVLVNGAPGTVTNFGSIGGGTSGVALNGGGTLVNAGTIAGNGNYAATFGQGGNLLVLQPGYKFIGGIHSAGNYNTVELQGSDTASVTANYNSLGLSGFETIAFAPGAGAYAALVIPNYNILPGTIAGFTGFNDRIDLTNLSDTGNDAAVSFNSGTDQLTITGDGDVTAVLQLDNEDYTGVVWKAINDGSGDTAVYRETPQSQPPAITNLTTLQAVPAGTAATPFAAASISDTSAADTVTVALSDPTAGTLSSSLGGSFDAATGVFSVTGSPAQVSTDLQSVVFTPSASASFTGYLDTTGFTIVVTGSGGSIGGSASVTETRQPLNLGSVPPASLALSVVSVSGSFAGPTGGDTNEAILLGPAPSGVYTLPSGYQAEFLGGSGAAALTDASVGGAMLIGNAGADTLSSTAAGDTLIGGGGGTSMQFVSGASDGIAFGGTDAISFFDAGSQDTLVGSSATTAATITGADALFFAQSGNATVTASGHADTLDGGSNAATMQFGSGASNGWIGAGSGAVTLSDAGSHDTLVGSSSTSTATITGANALFFAQSGQATVTASGNADTLVGGGQAGVFQFGTLATDGWLAGGSGTISLVDAGSHDTVVGSSSTSTATITGANAVFFAQLGQATVTASGNADLLIGGAQGGMFQFGSLATAGLLGAGSGPVTVSDAGSHDTVVGSGSTSVVTITGADALFFAQSGQATVTASGNADTLDGGSNASILQFGTNATAGWIGASNGAVTVSDAGSHDTVVGSSSTSVVTLTGGNALFFAGSGNATVAASGNADTVLGGSGSAVLQFGSTASDGWADPQTAAATLTDAGSNDTLLGSSATTAVSLSGSGGMFFQRGQASITDSGQNDTVIAGAAASSITASGSGLQVFGGSGSLDFTGGAHGATIVAGSGSATISGGSGGTTLFGGANGVAQYLGSSGGLCYIAGSGNETLNASGASSDNLLFGGADRFGQDSMVGGLGNDTMVAGRGADTLVGSSNLNSHNLFVFYQANGAAAPQDLVQQFSTNDQVLLSGYGADAAAAALAGAESNGSSTTITLSDNTTITFANIATPSSLTGHIVSV